MLRAGVSPGVSLDAFLWTEATLRRKTPVTGACFSLSAGGQVGLVGSCPGST